MRFVDLGPDAEVWLREAVGYLNFSSGASDPKFLRNLNALYALLDRDAPQDEPVETWRRLGELLGEAVRRVPGRQEAFADVSQAAAIVKITFESALPGYLEFHRDLLFHRKPASLLGPLFIGRVIESVLAQGPPWDEPQRIVEGAIGELNDFIGYRPVAVLRTQQKIQPYPHESSRPIPLYIAGVGAGEGPHRDVVQLALEILRQTDPELLEAAWFDLALLDELASDARAYDFDHPVNRRPNYHFGQWDPHIIDNRGHYRRFVVQQVTLDALTARLRAPGDLPRDEVLLEAAGVLAGTILMGSGTSGDSPQTHDSTVTLATLLPHIATYRDAFYDTLLQRTEGAHGERLRDEAARLKQPFAAARQHLNAELARLRASQLEHVHLAQAFAHMGYSEAARREAGIVPAASARMACDIRCRLTEAHLHLDHAAEKGTRDEGQGTRDRGQGTGDEGMTKSEARTNVASQRCVLIMLSGCSTFVIRISLVPRPSSPSLVLRH